VSIMYDVILVGAGPGGYATAIRAAQLGFKTAIVEREHLGGICLNWGCIPTKALLRSAEIKCFLEHAKDYGLQLDGSINVDIQAVVARSREVSARLNSGIHFLMKKNKIDIIWGEARVIRGAVDDKPAQIIVRKSEKLAVEILAEGVYEARHVIVATGARPRILSGVEPDGKLVWTYFEAIAPEAIPKSLVIVGSGAIGVEFASFYRDMGSVVTLIELQPQIMSSEDAEISIFARKQFERRGIRILTSARIQKIEKTAQSIIAHIYHDGKGQIIHAECLISAVGVQGNVENIGLESLGVAVDSGCIITDVWSRTNIPGIYAIGDVAGAPMLAHKAEKEGVICIEKIANLSTAHPLDKGRIPGCTYCTPQVASVGLTEEKAKNAGYDIRVGRYSFATNGKAIALGQDQGFVKTIFDRNSGQLLGAHMIGAEVTELIQGFVIAMNLETTEEELIHSIFPHPTLSETMKESILDAYDMVLNA